MLVMSTLCHDFGKPSTTTLDDNNVFVAHNHEAEGEKPTLSFLNKVLIGKDDIRTSIVNLVVNHLAHINPLSDKGIARLSRRLEPTTIDMLSYVVEADHSSRPPLPKELPQQMKDIVIRSRNLQINDKANTDIANGDDIISCAVNNKIPSVYRTGGRHFGVILNACRKLQEEGILNENNKMDIIILLCTNDLKTIKDTLDNELKSILYE